MCHATEQLQIFRHLQFHLQFELLQLSSKRVNTPNLCIKAEKNLAYVYQQWQVIERCNLPESCFYSNEKTLRDHFVSLDELQFHICTGMSFNFYEKETIFEHNLFGGFDYFQEEEKYVNCSWRGCGFKVETSEEVRTADFSKIYSHLATCHAQRKQFVCRCSASFTTAEGFKRHTRPPKRTTSISKPKPATDNYVGLKFLATFQL